MNKLPSISVFYPCFNEEENIPHFVDEALEVLPEIARKFEIIIVNDGSRDNTKQVGAKLAKKHSQVRLVNHSQNRGYGAALQTGFKAAQYEWVFFTDGDLQFQLKQLKKFVPHTEKYDVIIGYRRKRAEGFLRAFNARLFKVYIDLLFRVHVKDIDCAFKLLRTKTIQSLKLTSTGAFTSAEFLYRLKKMHVPFKQLPVDHQERKYGSPTGNNPKVIVKAGWEAMRLYLSMKFGIGG